MSAPEPYVGPRAFTLEDRARFFGRKDEVDETVSLIMAHPVVLIYALSGVGKSSLVNAGIIPMLREEDYAVLPPARVEGVIPAGISPTEIANPFVFHALCCWIAEAGVPFCGAEEVVNLRVSEFVGAWLKGRAPEQAESSPVLVLDQFEEIFTGNEARWKERDDFFRQMGEAVQQHPTLKVVFAMREEFIARLEPFASAFPRQLRIRKRLERLRGPAALVAITQPVEKLGVRFEPDVAEKLVSDLLGVQDEGGRSVAGEFVEPVQLQVVCRNLWEKLPQEIRDGTIGGRLRVITPAHLAAAGETTTALSNYYTDAIAAAVAGSKVNEGRLRRWFGETLIAGDHSSLGLAVKGHGETARIPESALQVLGSRYLIRHEKRGAAEWYELSHARFIEPILASNAKWLEQRSGAEAIRKKLQSRAQELDHTGGVFEEWELRNAEAYLAAPEAEDLGGREVLIPLVQRSREALSQRLKRRRQQRILLAFLAVTGLGAWVGFALAVSSAKTAHAQELALRAVDEIPRDPERALLLALESTAIKPTPAGLLAVRRALVASPIRLRLGGEKGIGQSVTTIAYSPDGKFIATGGLDHKVRVWDSAHGTLVDDIGGTTPTHTNWVWCVAFSPNGKTLATASRDGSVKLWPFPHPAETPWTPVQTLLHRDAKNEPITVRHITFDPSGTRLLASCHDGTARLWDTVSGQEILRLPGHTGDRNYVRAATFHPGGLLAVTAGNDGRLLLWDLTALPSQPATAQAPALAQPIATFPKTNAKEDEYWDVNFNADGTRLLTAGADQIVRIWDFATRTQLAELAGHAGAVIQAKWITDSRVVSVGIDKTVRIWSLKNNAVPLSSSTTGTPAEFLSVDGVVVLRGHLDYLRAVSVSPDLEHLATSSRDGTARVWRMPPGCESGLLRTGGIIRDLAYSPDSQRLVTAATKSPMVWGVRGEQFEKRLFALEGHTAIVQSVAYRPDGAEIATADTDGTAKLWDAHTGKEKRTLDASLTTVAYDPAGTALVGVVRNTPDAKNCAAIVDLNGAPQKILAGHTAPLTSAGFSLDGKFVATASIDATARIWDRTTGQMVVSLPPVSEKYPNGADNDILVDAAFSPDARWVATAGGDGNITIWELESKRLLALLKGHESQVRRVRFFHYAPAEPSSREERRHGRIALISTGLDSTTRLWEIDPRTGQWTERESFTAAPDRDKTVRGYAALSSPNGAQLAAGGEDGIARIYYRDRSWLWDLAQQRVTRKLTPGEREDARNRR